MYKEYIDQSAKTLSLNVFKGIPDMNQFSVLAEGNLETSKVSIKLYIIGASHVVEVNISDVCIFYEAFSCIPCKKTPDTILSYKIDKIESPIIKLIYPSNEKIINPAVYQFEYSIEDYFSSKDYLNKFETMYNNNQNVVLNYNFPQGGNEEIPKTILAVRINDQSINIESVHTYPNENTNVFTKTTIN